MYTLCRSHGPTKDVFDQLFNERNDKIDVVRKVRQMCFKSVNSYIRISKSIPKKVDSLTGF